MVSVIISAYNCEKYLLQSVNSILRQTYHDLEILICDDGSSDSTFQIAQTINDSRVRLFKNETNIGYLRTINRLLSETRGEFIAFQDADDISDSCRIELQVKYLQQAPEVSLVGTSFIIINEEGREVHRFMNQITDSDEIRMQLQFVNVFQKPSILFRRHIYEDIGGYREGFIRLKNTIEDYDWLLRASEKFRLSNINTSHPLYQYRSVATSSSRNYLSIEQHVGHLVAQLLAVERMKNNGIDSLHLENWSELESKIQQFKTPYLKDPSLFYFEKAEMFIYGGLFKSAVLMAMQAVIRSPFQWRNWRSLLSSIKRLVLDK